MIIKYLNNLSELDKENIYENINNSNKIDVEIAKSKLLQYQFDAKKNLSEHELLFLPYLYHSTLICVNKNNLIFLTTQIINESIFKNDFDNLLTKIFSHSFNIIFINNANNVELENELLKVSNNKRSDLVFINEEEKLIFETFTDLIKNKKEE